MISHLMVRNLALVDQIALDFGPGLNVLTGETGAGKSVLVSALSLVLGARAHSDVVRTGASEAVVEALFEGLEPHVIDRLNEMGVPATDGQLLVRRAVSRAGRSRVQLNGQLATVGMLGRLMKGVVDITSQHEHVTLLEPEAHLDALDAYVGLVAERRAVAAAYEEVRTCEMALAELQADEANKQLRAEELRQALEAIETAAPEPGELDGLQAELRRLRHQSELMHGIQAAEDALYSAEGAVVERVGQVLRTLERLATLDDVLGPTVAAMDSVAAELDDLARELAKYHGRLDADPGRLEAAEERLQTLRGLVRRHGGDLEAVFAAQVEMTTELASIEHAEARLQEVTATLEDKRSVLAAAVGKLSEGRQRGVGPLAEAIQRELVELSMDKAKLEVRLTPVQPWGPRGGESAELVISPNPGEPLRPLRRIASGGEMSRLLLALKNVLAHRNQAATYIFDEIDTGIGGAVAEVLGSKLRSVAETSQVIAVTHLPQVAAFADVHFQVEKALVGRRTVTEVTRLAPNQQVAELARMLGGLEITRATRSLAQEMRSRAIRCPASAGRRRMAVH